MTDTPYDGAVVYIDRITDKQICVIVHVPDESFTIGTYDNQDDAVYVLSLIQKTFMCNHKCFYMPEVEEVSVIRAKMKGGEKSENLLQNHNILSDHPCSCGISYG